MRTICQIGIFPFTRALNCLLACALLVIAPGVGAQLRFADRLPGGSHFAAASEKQALVDAIGRGELKQIAKAKSHKPGPLPDPNLLGLPHWTGSQKIKGKDTPFTIIGGDPAAGQTTVIPVVIIPYRFLFADGGVVDASTDVVDGVDEVDGILGSPVLNDYPFTAGSSVLGTTQFGDAYLRAAFWGTDGGSGSSYHTRLQVVGVTPPVEIPVPASLGFSVTVGGQTVGVIDGGALLELTKSVVGAFGIPSPVLTIHATGQTIGTGAVGFLGYHDWVDASAQTGVPGVSNLLTVGWFSNTISPGGNNAAVLGHEVLEWLMNPIAGNVVPGWADPAKPHLCYSNYFEVADPLEDLPGHTFKLGGYGYTLPDAVFPAWFSGVNKARDTVNGWYSLYNTVSAPTQACPFFEWPISFYFPNDVGMTESHLTGANNHKQVSGYFVQYGELVSFVLGNVDPLAGVPATLDMIVSVPGASVTVARRVNDAGQVAGLYFDPIGIEHGFLFSGGQYASIDYPGALGTEVLGINDQNVPTLVGDYVDASGAVHGFTLKAGVFTTIDVPGAVGTAIWDVNDTNQVAGRFGNGSQVRSFSGNPGRLSILDYLGNPAFTTAASSINAAGIVAGNEVDAAGFGSGFLFGAGNFMAAHLDEANGINEADSIVGSLFVGGGPAAAIAMRADPLYFAPSASTTLVLPQALLHRH
ncbi:hypothetical protein [Rudaea cellulosilytica]|uniref:hypothetical protein n=1 Tax=Rudaea cellulosilytica TaxID=540746 RepID=UPI0012FBC718|nr:hypothetical protein [Rudaea cellulosilytica]